MKKIGLIIFTFICAFKIHAQEQYFGGNGGGDVLACLTQINSTTNSIYFGGNDDGYAISCYVQVDASLDGIFSGGGGNDGYAISCYDQTDATVDSLYAGGGDNDGFSISCYVQPNSPMNNFYYGGVDDGFAISCYVQPDLSADNIFLGGNDDGFVMTCYTQAHSLTKGMYSGAGISAGFAFSCVGSLNNEVPLPIELLSFDAILNGNKVDLLWSTASEINSDYFVIEKTIDVITFEEVAIVNGAGNSSNFISYTEVDDKPYAGISYYRLKQVDFNGNYSFSSLVPIRYVKDMQIEIYPNPVDGNIFYLSINSEREKDLKLLLYNSLGEVIYTTSFIQQGGTTLKMINVPKDLATGIYFVVVQSKGKLFKQKLIVK